MVENVMSIIHEILAVDKNDLLLALGLLKNHPTLNVRDSIHAAVAIRNNFKYIISADKHFNKLRGLQRIDPNEF
jgi:predicted nucleic acid-binding protein